VRRLAEGTVFDVRAAVRRPGTNVPGHTQSIAVGDLDGTTDWTRALSGVDVVVHLAGRAHVLKNSDERELEQIQRINVAGSSNLARQAATCGVSRLVFISSIKVHGEEGAFSEQDKPAPANPYAISKLEAEMALTELAKATGIHLVIIRPPLVYGAGAKGNLAVLVKAIRLGIPLPLGRIHNRRSLIAIENLVDFITLTIDHPAAANEVFLVSDGEDLSTTELVRRLARALNKPARMFPVPARFLRIAAPIVGRGGLACHLLGSLWVDSTKASSVLGWSAPLSVDQAMGKSLGFAS